MRKASVRRCCCSGLALRQGFSYEEVEALRRAVDEAVRLLVGPARRPSDRLTVTFRIEPSAIGVELAGRTDGRPLAHLEDAACARFTARVAPLVDSVRVEPAAAWVDLTKLLSTDA